MTLTTIFKQAERLAADNSPLILTAVGVVGTVTTAVLTGKAAFQAAQILDRAASYDEVTEPIQMSQKVNLTWKLYIPPAVVGATTIASIITANRIGTRRAAAMAAAYAVSDKAFSEYKEKILEKLGEPKERSMRDDLAQDQVNRQPVTDREVIITGTGNVLCFEPATGRYFHSDMETLKKAMNDLNYQVNNNYYASLSDFYNLIGLEPTTYSDELGWNSDRLLELRFTSVLAADGRPCLTFEYQTVPIKGYARVN